LILIILEEDGWIDPSYTGGIPIGCWKICGDDVKFNFFSIFQ
jgi:hypothetical protein